MSGNSISTLQASIANGASAPSQAQRDIDLGLPLTAEINDGTKNNNPKDISFRALVAEDFRIHDSSFFCQGFWVLFWHRFGNARMNIRFRPLRMLFSLIYRILVKLTEGATGIDLKYSVAVGRRVKLEHFGGMILAARAIGNDVFIRQNTTIGVTSRHNVDNLPTIGDGVDIGAGAVVLGDITIGKGAVIGANAVVIKDVEAGTTVGGVPAKVIKQASDEA